MPAAGSVIFVNSMLGAGAEDGEVRRDPRGGRRLVNFAVFCAGADIKEFTKMTDPAAGKELLDGGHGVLRRMEQ